MKLKCKAIKKLEKAEIHVSEMYMLRRMCGITINNRIGNKYIRSNLKTIAIEDKRKIPFEMIQAHIGKAMKCPCETNGGVNSGRPIKTLGEAMRKCTSVYGVTKRVEINRV